MTDLNEVWGRSPSIPGTVAAIGNCAGRYVEVVTCEGRGAEVKLTMMTEHTKTRYVKKSPGCVNLGDPTSSMLPYVYRKYGSSNIPNWGPDNMNDVTTRHSCGNSVKTFGA